MCCIIDATNICSLPSSSHRPPWCNTSPKTSLQPRNPILLHQQCNKRPLANLFLLHSTVMQHLSPWNHSLLHQRWNKRLIAILFLPHSTVMQHLSLRDHSLCNKPSSLTSYFCMPPWCNISPKTYLQPWNPSVLHRWCNMHMLANLFLLHATVMQHLSLRSHGVLHQRCNKHSSLTYSFCRPPS